MRAVGFTDCVAHEVQHGRVCIDARTELQQGRLDKSATSQLGLQTPDATAVAFRSTVYLTRLPSINSPLAMVASV